MIIATFLKTNIRVFLLIFCLLFNYTEGFGQFRIKGKIVDAETGKALEFATVFINNSTFGDITDQNGEFEISIPPGNYDLVISYMGYQPFSFAFTTDALREFYKFRILSEPIDLDETQVSEKRDRIWYRNLDTFIENFLGNSINSQKCKILNPEVLILDSESEKGILKANAREILEIQNPNLGYNLKYVLTGFEYNEENGKVAFAGYPYFVSEDLAPRRLARMGKNRERAFHGSNTHLMRSLYAGTAEEEGFELFSVDQIPNPERPDDDQIQKAMTILEETKTFLVRDSLKREIAKAELPKFIDAISEKPLDGMEIIQKTSDGKVFLTYNKPFYVVFKNEVEEPNYKTLKSRNVKSKINTIGMGMVASGGTEESLPQTTRIHMLSKAVQIFENGSYYHPFDLYLEGYMAWEKIGDLMPFDYKMK